MGLYLARTIDIAAVGKTAGYDWLFIDMEHSALDVSTAGQIAAAAIKKTMAPSQLANAMMAIGIQASGLTMRRI